jgi:SAM-dependent methyltransferase
VVPRARSLAGLFFLAAAASLSTARAQQEGERRTPFIRTPEAVVARMLELGETGPADFVIDLGSGDGRIVIAAAQRFGARGVGIDIDGRLVALSRKNAAAAGVADKVRFIEADVLAADISQASVVTVYLLPEVLWRLQPRFLSELQPGTRIVSHEFRMTGWAPDRMETIDVASPGPGQAAKSDLYLWVVPADVRGTWRGAGEEIRIAQNYQRIEIEGASGAALRGREISWQSPRGRFRGVANADRIAGRLEKDGAVRDAVFERAR